MFDSDRTNEDIFKSSGVSLQIVSDLKEKKLKLLEVSFEAVIRLIEQADWDFAARRQIIACGGSEKDWLPN
ncbi:hypothetical protein [Marinilactibacillus kalidii]|uniref:hypothetical protein n=1 Tax=Marinilactibacillus kalidii TaxID=2820274 RepID=UPI001ABE7C8D|nr:hypothetical protein [Marinilactibacillus kalidii]